MCYPIACATCGRATYAGCGQHVEEVLGHLPASERCRCHLAPEPEPAASLRAIGGSNRA